MDLSNGNNTDQWGTGTAVEVYTNIVSHLTSPPAKAMVDRADSYLSFDSLSALVLDNGCGSGVITVEIARRYPNIEILATDLSPGMIEKVVARKLRNVTAQVVDGMDLSSIHQSYPNGFSHVLSNFMNQFAPDPFKVLTEMIDIARPGAVVGMGSWGKLDYCDVLILCALEIDPKWQPVWFTSTRTWPEDDKELAALFERHGLTDVKSERMFVGYPFQSFDDLSRYFLDGKNPGLERIVDDFRSEHGQEGVEKIRAVLPSVMEREGMNLEGLRLEVFITSGRKA